LVTAELALALILLAGAGLLIKGFLRLRSVDPGFNPGNVITMYLQLPGTRYPQIPLQTNFRRELLGRINSFPGVEAAMITDLPQYEGLFLGCGFRHVKPTTIREGRSVGRRLLFPWI
jgi:putative ABC transport system permease protein